MITKDMIPIDQWLVLGSFPMHEMRRGRWLENGYPCEADFAPAVSDTFDGKKWKPFTGEHVNFLDPKLKLNPQSFCFGYAVSYLHLPRRQKVRFIMGSDDGAQVWLDGKQIHAVECERPLDPEQDVLPVTIGQGWHTLVCKVTQFELSWGIVVRLSGSEPGRSAEFSCTNQKPRALGKGRLATRKNGLIAAHEVPRIVAQANGGDLDIQLGFRLFNDSADKASKLQAALTDGNGNVFGKTSGRQLKPFGSWDVRLGLGKDGLLSALAEGQPLEFSAGCSRSEVSLPVADGVAGGVFFSLLKGMDVPLDLDAEVTIPEFYRGHPASIETYASNEQPLSREISWPKLPQREVTAKETAKGKVKVGLEPPVGVSGLRARILFGDSGTREQIKRIAFYIEDLSADLKAADAPARKGLAAYRQGDFTAAVAVLDEFENALKQGVPDRAAHEVTLMGHGHIDMDWLWTSAETVQCCHDMFRQVLEFMDEFPKFHFSQSQASTYRYIEQNDPVMFERIRRRVMEGRWELLGGMVTEGDTNLSGGEGIARALLYGQRYFQSRFGKTARVGWLPDNFGHVAQLPQLLRLAGIQYFYGFRCQPKVGAYRWEGIDGTRTLNFTTPGYNGAVTPHLAKLPEEYDPENKKAMWIYGVGDHGGGPTRQDITRAESYQSMAGVPKIEFGTAKKFFDSIESHAEDYPLFKGELQYIFEGCYTSIARVKEGNRKCENTLYGAELLAALNALDGADYPTDTFTECWEDVAYNQFHDILCGSAIHASNRESIATYDGVLAEAERERFAALRWLAGKIKTRTDLGRPLAVFNSLSKKRTDVVEVEVFSYLAPPSAQLKHWGNWSQTKMEAVDHGQGPYATVELQDEKGDSIPAQIVDGKLFPNGYRMKVQFLAEDVPACGTRVFYVRPEKIGTAVKDGLKVKGTTVETPYLKVEVDPKTGHLTRVYDRKRKKDIIDRKDAANVLKIYMEKPHGMSAWIIGPISKVIQLDKADSVRVVEQGPVRAVIEVERKWDRSSFIQRIIVYRDLPRVDFELDARWFQLGGPNQDSPMLRVAFPLNVKRGKFFCDTPFAPVERPITGQEVPAQMWTDLSGAGGGAAILNNSKYGHCCYDSTLEMALLRASYDPDLYPDQGPHLIRYSLLPHAGDWAMSDVQQEGLAFNRPMLGVELPPNEAGEVKQGESLLSLEPGNLHLAAFKKAEDGDGWIARFYEGQGKATDAMLTLPRIVKNVERVDLLEQLLEDAAKPKILGRKVKVKLKPYEIVTLRLRF